MDTSHFIATAGFGLVEGVSRFHKASVRDINPPLKCYFLVVLVIGLPYSRCSFRGLFCCLRNWVIVSFSSLGHFEVAPESLLVTPNSGVFYIWKS